MVQYSSHSGESLQEAVIISKVANHSAGVQAEYDYVIKKHGQPRIGWMMQGQSLIENEGRAYDRLDIVLKDGSQKSYYFDITEFFGKFEDELMQLKPQPSLLQQIFGAIRRLFGG